MLNVLLQVIAAMLLAAGNFAVLWVVASIDRPLPRPVRRPMPGPGERIAA